MSSLFLRTIKQAFITFDKANLAGFSNNFRILKQLVNQITVQDLNLNPDLLTEEAFSYLEKAPCTYVHIFETIDFSMSVFILKSNYTMPLHDHPVMHGLLKALSGEILVQSFTRIPSVDQQQQENSNNDLLLYNPLEKEVKVRIESPKLVTNSTECAELTPTERNYHEITALNGVAAFFDILSPPYDTKIPIYGKRKCSYYKKSPINDDKNQTECTLIKIPSPATTYYCDTVEYDAPKFIQDLNESSSSIESDVKNL